MNRERLGSRLGFILLSAGCAIGCGNVWKFPWMAGQYGGGGFVLIYVICLLLLGLPILVVELTLGRASQASPVRMYQKLEKPGHKWHIHGYLALFGNFCLMAFYTVVAGWIIYYFYKFLVGQYVDLGFVTTISNPKVNIIFLAIVVVVGFLILCFKLQSGLERITKYMMAALLIIIVVLAVRSLVLPGAVEGLKFYLLPDFGKINGKVVVAAMNQAFFTLGLGMGSMAIFGSYIDKKRSLLGESVNIIILDSFVAIMAGLIIFPACTTYGVKVNSGPGLLFDTMVTVFNNMNGGRVWGTIFFLFMVFAAMSTVLAVFENILACIREMTGWSRPKGCILSAVIVFLFSITTALGYNVWSGFVPFAEGSAWLDVWDFILNCNLLAIGAVVMTLFTCFKFGWGWDNFILEANMGKGLKIKSWMKPIFRWVVPVVVIFLYIYGLATYNWQ